MTMTKQEYDAKAANGTLTLRDVIENEEHASPELLRKLNGRTTGEALRRIRASRQFHLIIVDVIHLFSDIPARYATADLLGDWETLTDKTPSGTATNGEFWDVLDNLKGLSHKINDLLASGDLPKAERKQLTKFGKVVAAAMDAAADIVLDGKQAPTK